MTTSHCERLLEVSSRLWDRTLRSCVIRIVTVESAGFSSHGNCKRLVNRSDLIFWVILYILDRFSGVFPRCLLELCIGVSVCLLSRVLLFYSLWATVNLLHHGINCITTAISMAHALKQSSTSVQQSLQRRLRQPLSQCTRHVPSSISLQRILIIVPCNPHN